MANVLAKGSLFPPELTDELINLVNGKSSLAKLAAQRPLSFVGNEIFTFTLDKEVDVVAENGAKSNGGATMGSVSIVPVKIEYGTRVSDEFKYASEEQQIEYLRAFAEGFAAKAARGLDIMGFHGLNPRTDSASAVIGTNHFDSLVTNTVNLSSDPNANVESAVALVQGGEYEVTGMAMSPAFRSALAGQVYTSDNRPMFPELAWGSQPATIKGLPVDTNSTVSFGTNTVDNAIIGNFRDFFRWGVAKDIPIEIIEYGNPDNDANAGDLKGHNQIYLRGEMYIGWGILVPAAFARIVTP